MHLQAPHPTSSVSHDPSAPPSQLAGQAAFMQQVLNNFGFTLLLAASTAYAAWGLDRSWMGGIMLLELLLVIGLVFFRSSEAVSGALVYAFAACSGATTVPLLQWALRTTGETGVIYNALAITGAIFMGMAWYGSNTGKDLSSWSTFLHMGLFGTFVASLVGLFVGYSTVTQLVISSAVVITFTGFVAYDIQMIRRDWRSHTVHSATLTLYLDFMNLFVHLLRLLVLLSGNGRSND